VQQTPLFESSQEWKLKASRDRGLRPLLRFIAKLINRHLIDKIDDHFVFEFAGLDELTEQEKHELLKEQISTYLTLNEGRRTLDLPDLEGGDVPLNPVYLQGMQMMQAKQQQDQQQQMAAQQPQQGQPVPGAEQGAAPQVPGASPGQEGAVPGADAGEGGRPPDLEGATGGEPQYTANLGKSSNQSREIRITFDDWLDSKRR
jgi:hypothetical protein